LRAFKKQAIENIPAKKEKEIKEKEKRGTEQMRMEDQEINYTDLFENVQKSMMKNLILIAIRTHFPSPPRTY
jgi:hypothetical protein